MQKFIKPGLPATNKEESINLEFIQKEVNRINSMRNIIYEIKAGTPYGKIILIFLNLIALQEKAQKKTYILSNIPLNTLAGLTGVTVAELRELLDFLQQQGIIFYRTTVD